MNKPLYSLKGVEKRYRQHIALRIHALTLSEGGMVGLAGPNGSGKSTLLRLLAFLETPSKGEILFKGTALKPFSREARLQIALLDQKPYLLKRTVFENVAYGLKIRGEVSSRSARVRESLSWVGLPAEDFAGRKWHELSGGEGQRVALAARLVLRPKVLLLDEPTGNVDAASAELIKQAVLRAREEWGSTLIIASHDRVWLSEVAEKTLNLHNGRLLPFDEGRVLFGPWEPHGNNGWRKILPDGQPIKVPPPPREDAVAILNTDRIALHTSPPDESSGSTILCGVLSSVTMQPRSGRITASILVGGVAFTVEPLEGQIQEGALFPGRTVWLAFPLEAVHWTPP